MNQFRHPGGALGQILVGDVPSKFEKHTRSEGGGVTPIRGMVYMCLPGLWVNLRYFARVMGHVL